MNRKPIYTFFLSVIHTFMLTAILVGRPASGPFVLSAVAEPLAAGMNSLLEAAHRNRDGFAIKASFEGPQNRTFIIKDWDGLVATLRVMDQNAKLTDEEFREVGFKPDTAEYPLRFLGTKTGVGALAQFDKSGELHQIVLTVYVKKGDREQQFYFDSDLNGSDFRRVLHAVPGPDSRFIFQKLNRDPRLENKFKQIKAILTNASASRES